MRLTDKLDYHVSPITGYTRAHWLEITERIVAGVLPYVDPESGLVRLPADEQEWALAGQLVNPGGLNEAFDRTIIAVAAWHAGSGRRRLAGYPHDVIEVYQRGIASLCDPQSEHFAWRRGLSGLVLAMLLARDAFWDELDEHTRNVVIAHAQKYIHRGGSDCNTLLFAMMPAAVLEWAEADYDRATLDDHFETILSMYRGDGWFIDGWNRGFDHYNFWGFQLYLHAMMAHVPRWREKYAPRVQEITQLHERTLPYCFGQDGAPVPKGRSLNYRFATVCGLPWAQLSGLSQMDPGQARRIASGCLKYFYERGCLSDRGLLEPGYLGSNTAVGEDYTDRGAPYWAATTLAALALPENHDFWRAHEKPIPADGEGHYRCAIRGAEMVLKVDATRGEARMITIGESFYHRRVWQAGSKYYQHGYSSSLGHALAGDQGPELAAGRTGLSEDGRRWSYRTWPRLVDLGPQRARHTFDAWPALAGLTGTIVTETLILDRGEIHLFWHTGPQERFLRIGGWSIQVPHGEGLDVQPLAGGRMVSASEGGAGGDERTASGWQAEGGDGLELSSSTMWSVMQVLGGPSGSLSCEEVHPRPGFSHAHLFGGWAGYPTWTSAGLVNPREIVAVFVDAARRSEADEMTVPEIGLEMISGGVRVMVDERQYDVMQSAS